ncbi:hypothetical protein CRENBAI_002099 [Crenichthys baileyi]|uniref:Uncharacterized protein n=1 Tax=Crenichthys baileyi TaxID=28760 RepID=A0AAV9R433_9TELE
MSAYNAFVLWWEANPGWISQTRHRRRLFLEQLDSGFLATGGQSARQVVAVVEEDDEQEQAQEDEDEAKGEEEEEIEAEEAVSAEEKKTQTAPA